MYRKSDLLELYSDPEFYDIEFAERTDEIPFYEKFLNNKLRVLEVACGTGRIINQLALNKPDVDFVGTDLSADMINQAKANASRLKISNIQFHVSEMTKTTGLYDLIICASNALQHLLTDSEILSFLVSCHASLSDNGKLVFDIQQPDQEKLQRDLTTPYQYKSFTYKDELIQAFIDGNYDQNEGIFYFNISYLENRQKQIKVKKVAMNMLTHDRMLGLVNKTPLNISEIYGDFNFEQFGKESKKQIFVLKKST